MAEREKHRRHAAYRLLPVSPANRIRGLRRANVRRLSCARIRRWSCRKPPARDAFPQTIGNRRYPTPARRYRRCGDWGGPARVREFRPRRRLPSHNAKWKCRCRSERPRPAGQKAPGRYPANRFRWAFYACRRAIPQEARSWRPVRFLPPHRLPPAPGIHVRERISFGCGCPNRATYPRYAHKLCCPGLPLRDAEPEPRLFGCSPRQCSCLAARANKARIAPRLPADRLPPPNSCRWRRAIRK